MAETARGALGTVFFASEELVQLPRPLELYFPGCPATSGRAAWFVNEFEKAAARPTRFQNKEMKGGGGTVGACGSLRRRRGGGGGGGGGCLGRQGVPC